MITEQHIRTMAIDMLRDNYLYGWTVKFTNSRKQIGLCSYSTKTVTFSRRYFNVPETNWFNIVSHEVAHAIVGPGHGHGAIWKRQHRALGGDGERLQRGVRLPHDQRKYRIVDSSDGRILGYRDRVTKNLRESVCVCHLMKPQIIQQN